LLRQRTGLEAARRLKENARIPRPAAGSLWAFHGMKRDTRRIPDRSKVSAGLLLYRRRGGGAEVLLAHPGGPFFARKDEGAWSIPKGEVAEGEELLAAAVREFREEIGIEPAGAFIPLGSVKQKGGKTVHAWAVEGDYDTTRPPPSNAFQLEWPPRSGKMSEFPEIDRVEFFSLETAAKKINPAQASFIDELARSLSGSRGTGGSR